MVNIEKQKKRAYRLYLEGFSFADIAKRIKKTKQTVINWSKKECWSDQMTDNERELRELRSKNRISAKKTNRVKYSKDKSKTVDDFIREKRVEAGVQQRIEEAKKELPNPEIIEAGEIIQSTTKMKHVVEWRRYKINEALFDKIEYYLAHSTDNFMGSVTTVAKVVHREINLIIKNVQEQERQNPDSPARLSETDIKKLDKLMTVAEKATKVQERALPDLADEIANTLIKNINSLHGDIADMVEEIRDQVEVRVQDG